MSNQKFLIGVIVLALIVSGILVYTFRVYKPSPPRHVVVALPLLGFPPRAQLVEGFKQEMKNLGYKEGVDVTYKDREPIKPNPPGVKEAREVMKVYIEEDVDLILVLTNTGAKIALEETKAAGKVIPIVGIDLFDPVDKGIIESYKSSGSNLTGVAEKRADTVGKLLDMLIKIAPETKSIGALTNGFIIPSEVAPAKDFIRSLKQQAAIFGLELVEYTTTVSSGPELEKELARMLDGVKEGEVDAWVHIPGHFVPTQQVFVHNMTQRVKIPYALPAAIEVDPKTGKQVGLFSYSVDFRKKGKQGATIADKIFRGVEPSEIPIEFPEKYELVINLKIAEGIGLIVPGEIFEIIDRVIEE